MCYETIMEGTMLEELFEQIFDVAFGEESFDIFEGVFGSSGFFVEVNMSFDPDMIENDLILSFEPIPEVDPDLAEFLSGNVSSLLNKISDIDDDGILSESLGTIAPWKDDIFAPSILRDNPMSEYFHHADFDHDGIENFLDNYFGPGSESPFGNTLGVDTSFFDDYQPIDFDMYFENFENSYNEAIDAFSNIESNFSIDDISDTITDNFNVEDAWHWQEAPNSCAVAVQTDILNDFGIDVSEADMREMADEMGIYTHESGTPLSDVGKLLEKYGINLDKQRDGFSIMDLIEAKNDGEKIILGLDAAEIWGDPNVVDHPLEEASGGFLDIPTAGHAVEFKGIIEDAFGNIKVILDDPGRPDGNNFTVLLEDFLDAWEDFGNFAVITRTK